MRIFGYSLIIFLAVCIAAVAGFPGYGEKYIPQRIVGGSVTTIDAYPSIATVLFSFSGATFSLFCGCSVLNNRSFLTAAHCTVGRAASSFRIRVGSTWASSGGVVHNAYSLINHANYSPNTYDNDISIIRSASTINFNNQVRPANIPSANYNLGDNQVVYAAGWGAQYSGGPASEQLRHVQIWTVNQNTCAERYANIRMTITANMLCSGWLDVGGRDQCQGDSGGPLYHNGVTVGICSFGQGCALAFYPGVNARVSRYTSWILNNA